MSFDCAPQNATPTSFAPKFYTFRHLNDSSRPNIRSTAQMVASNISVDECNLSPGICDVSNKNLSNSVKPFKLFGGILVLRTNHQLRSVAVFVLGRFDSGDIQCLSPTATSLTNEDISFDRGKIWEIL